MMETSPRTPREKGRRGRAAACLSLLFAAAFLLLLLSYLMERRAPDPEAAPTATIMFNQTIAGGNERA